MYRTVGDVGVGVGAASMPLWAAQSQEWFIWIAAVAGGVLAILRLGVFLWEQWVRFKEYRKRGFDASMNRPHRIRWFQVRKSVHE